jgi:hypothetical protein
MTAFLLFTESEPRIVMASRTMVREGRLPGELRDRGIGKFIAHELPVEGLRARYGIAFEVIEDDVRRGKELRFLDSNGGHVFDTVTFADLGATIVQDS